MERYICNMYMYHYGALVLGDDEFYDHLADDAKYSECEKRSVEVLCITSTEVDLSTHRRVTFLQF